MLVHFNPRGSVYTMGIDLFSPPDPFYRYFWSGGSIYSSPRTALGGTESQCHRKLTRSGNTLSVKA